MDIKNLPVQAIELGHLFNKANFELALVGGSVRDILLQKESYDLDFTTNAKPVEIKKILKNYLDDLWSVGEKFGTIGGNKDNVQIEITTYRTDQYEIDSRKPEIKFGKTLEEDLIRRDFTINCLAIKLPQIEFVDLFNGITDIATKTIRTPSDPMKSFSDDPLRILRAARFTSTLGFTIEMETGKAIIESASRLAIISKERIRDEFTKLMLGNDPASAIHILSETGVMDYICKEFKLLHIEDPSHLHKDVYTHSLKVLTQAIEISKNENLSRDDDSKPSKNEEIVLRLAALFHDIAKPQTKRIDPKNHKVSFLGHDIKGAKMMSKTLNSLKFEKDIVKRVYRLIYMHLRAYGYKTEAEWTDSAVRRYTVDAEDNIRNLLILTRADVTSENPKKVKVLYNAFDELQLRIKELQEKEELSKLRPALDGNEIMNLFGWEPGPKNGPKIGKILKYLMEIRLEQGEISKEEATELVKKEFKDIDK